MNAFTHGVVRAVAESFTLPEPILEIGSYQVAGQEDVADLRSVFLGKKYVGLDIRPGPGVDVVADVEKLPQASSSVGTVVALNTFEHVPRFWRAVEEIHRVLRPDGAVLISVPFCLHIHNYPADYWRFTPEALDFLLQDFPQRILGSHGPERRPIGVWAVGFREEAPTVAPEQFEQYRQKLATMARNPLRPQRRFLYRLARLLCGSRPFAPYLEHERWTTEQRVRRTTCPR